MTGGAEIVEGVHRIDAEFGGRPLYLFLFLGERRLLLDAGSADTVAGAIVPYLAGLGLEISDLDVLLITHSDVDHQGGAHELKRQNPSLLVTCGALDVPLVSDPELLVSLRYDAYRADHGIGYDDETRAWLREQSGEPVAIDVGWTGGELVRLGPEWELRLLHVPGHAPGHIAALDLRSGALFSGDCLQGSVYLGLDGTRKLCPTYTHVDQYLATAALVESLAPSELHACHWPPQIGDGVAEFLAETRGYVEDVDRLVRDGLAQPATLRELIARVNRVLEQPWPEELAEELVYSIHGHVERLVELGLATAERNGSGRLVYRSAA